MLRVCIHAPTPRVHPRRSASKSKPNRAANLSAGAGGGAARRRNDSKTGGNEIDDNHLRYEQPRCRQQESRRPSRRPQRKRKPQTRRQPSINPLFVRSSDEQLREAPTSKPRRTNRKTQAPEEIKEDSTPKNLRWLGIIAICATASWDVFRTPFCRSKIICTFAPIFVLRHRALAARMLLRRPRISTKVARLLSNIFGSIRNLLNIWLVE